MAIAMVAAPVGVRCRERPPPGRVAARRTDCPVPKPRNFQPNHGLATDGKRFGEICGLILAAAALAVALAGCALAPPQPEISPQGDQRFAERRPAVEALRNWQLTGRAAFAGPADSGTAALDWRQQGEHYRVLLRAPLGSGSMRLEGDERGATLTTSRGEQAQATDAGALVRELTGYALPVDVLPYWLRGLPAPGARENAGFDADGLLRRLRQAGWEVRYQEYGEFLGLRLPVRLELENDSWRLRIVVSQWRPPA